MNEERLANILKIMKAMQSSDPTELLKFMPGIGENKDLLTILKLLPTFMNVRSDVRKCDDEKNYDEKIYLLTQK